MCTFFCFGADSFRLEYYKPLPFIFWHYSILVFWNTTKITSTERYTLHFSTSCFLFFYRFKSTVHKLYKHPYITHTTFGFFKPPANFYREEFKQLTSASLSLHLKFHHSFFDTSDLIMLPKSVVMCFFWRELNTGEFNKQWARPWILYTVLHAVLGISICHLTGDNTFNRKQLNFGR